jgi:hypothetical protein
VIGYAADKLGWGYNVRQLLDLARFLFPWGLLPRRWRSSLFEHNAGAPTKTVCSSLLAEAFSAVHFPVLPLLERGEDGRLRLHKRNFKLFTPRDFDYSPYFEIIKYPIFNFDEIALYRRLPWEDLMAAYEGKIRGALPAAIAELQGEDTGPPAALDPESDGPRSPEPVPAAPRFGFLGRLMPARTGQ